MIQQISILGCGWLGLPLGEFHVKKNFKVKGSTTKEEKINAIKQAGITPFLFRFDPHYSGDEIKDFLSTDLLIINIPPSLKSKSEDFHIRQIQELVKYLNESPVKKVIYISSTSIYPDLNREVKEGDVISAEQAENKTLFEAEKILKKQNRFETTILRCSGLAGYDRILVKHFAGKKNLPMGNAPVNLIHRDDVIEIIYEVIKKNKWNEVYNICTPLHPLRKNFYPKMAKEYGYEVPEYNPADSSPFKIIMAEKMIKDLDYKFKFPDPGKFYYNF